MKPEYLKFFEACSNGHLDNVKAELHFSPSLVQADDYNGVRLACAGGHQEIVRYLCEDAPITSILHSLDWECLKEACQQGHLPVVDYIVKSSSLSLDFIVKSFEECCVRGHLDLVIYFQKLQPELSSSTEGFDLACQYNSLAVVEHFIYHGIYEQEGVIEQIENKNYSMESKILELIKIREEKKLLDNAIQQSTPKSIPANNFKL